MASFGMDPASAADRLGHTDGGALFLHLYRHLYEGEKRRQADLFGARVQALLDEEWTDSERDLDFAVSERAGKSGRNQTLRKPADAGRRANRSRVTAGEVWTVPLVGLRSPRRLGTRSGSFDDRFRCGDGYPGRATCADDPNSVVAPLR
jgi:hypothetical protein